MRRSRCSRSLRSFSSRFLRARLVLQPGVQAGLGHLPHQGECRRLSRRRRQVRQLPAGLLVQIGDVAGLSRISLLELPDLALPGLALLQPPSASQGKTCARRPSPPAWRGPAARALRARRPPPSPRCTRPATPRRASRPHRRVPVPPGRRTTRSGTRRARTGSAARPRRPRPWFAIRTVPGPCSRTRT